MVNEAEIPSPEELQGMMEELREIGALVIRTLVEHQINDYMSVPALALVVGFLISQKIKCPDEAIDMVQTILEVSIANGKIPEHSNFN